MTSSNPVADQYVRYPYPEPVDDIPTFLSEYNYDPHEPGPNAALFWPEGQPRTDLNILVAGCGAMQAAVLAFKCPECRVTGVDFSSTSIAHEEKLRERHKLTNLTLRTMDLLKVHELGEQFDLIVSSGVLHHLSDVGAGLRAVSSVLERSHGAMILMLYGRIARSGIYVLQDAFRRMGIEQTPEGVRTMRSIFRRLPPHHPGRHYYDYSPEMKSDAAVVDTFLHPQDIAFSVPELLDLVQANGLKFQGWLDSGVYNQPLEWLERPIPDRDHWSIIEGFGWNVPTHHFIACRPERDKRSEIKFSGDEWLAYYPQPRPTLQEMPAGSGIYARKGYEFGLFAAERLLMSAANGQQTVRAILRDKSFAKVPAGEVKTFARAFYEKMWRQGHIFFSTVPVRNAAPGHSP
jgi:SAM-dependent methyltransferase